MIIVRSYLHFAFYKKAWRILVKSAFFYDHNARIILPLAPLAA